MDKDLGARNVEKKVQELLHELAVGVMQEDNKKTNYRLTSTKNAYRLN